MATLTKIEVNEEERYVRTTFGDGLEIVARPVADEESIARAYSLGYLTIMPAHVLVVQEALWQMCRDHDRLHTLLAEAEGKKYSVALRYAALGHKPPSMVQAEIDREERIVLLMQRLMNVGVDALVAERSSSEPETK